MKKKFIRKVTKDAQANAGTIVRDGRWPSVQEQGQEKECRQFGQAPPPSAQEQRRESECEEWGGLGPPQGSVSARIRR